MIFVKRPAKFKVKGFTLIEVLIGLTLLSIMAVLLFTSLKICADSWERGEEKMASVNEMAVVYHFFQEYLSVTKPVLIESDNGSKAVSFQGGIDSLQFVSKFPESVNKIGLQIFKAVLVKDGVLSNINVSVTPYYSGAVDEDEETSNDEVSLIKNVKEFKLSYFGSENELNDGVWVDEWINKTVLPQLIRINIVLESGNYWPEIIIPLRITAPNQDSNEKRGIIP